MKFQNTKVSVAKADDAAAFRSSMQQAVEDARARRGEFIRAFGIAVAAYVKTLVRVGGEHALTVLESVRVPARQ